jgi:hypothetical protein
MIGYLEDANVIYSSTKFDPDDEFECQNLGRESIQLAVAKVTVFEAAYTSAETDIKTANPWRAVNYVDSNAFLTDFGSTNGKIPLEHDKYCLAHGFSALDFNEGVLGLAWLGTICSGNQNTGIATNVNFGREVSYSQAMIVVTHEIGHNFGMPHDTDCSRYCNHKEFTDHAAKCSDGIEFKATDVNNKHVMWPVSVEGDDTNNDIFSECSRYFASQKLASPLYNRMHCLTDTDPGKVCGNGIVQGTELCDCGVKVPSTLPDKDYTNQTSWTDKDKADWNAAKAACKEADKCCLPTCELDRPEFKGGTGIAQCTNQNDPLCCDGDCMMKGLDPTSVLVNTVAVWPQGSALNPDDEEIICQEETDCTGKAYCIKDQTMNGICPSRALKSVVKECEKEKDACVSTGEDFNEDCAKGTDDNTCTVLGADCVWEADKKTNSECVEKADMNDKWYQDLLWNPPGMLCNEIDGEFQATCNTKGECQASLCAAFQTADDNLFDNFKPVSCELADEDGGACQIGCIFETGGNCVNVQALETMDGSNNTADYSSLAPGSGTNKLGAVFPNVSSKQAGTPCASYTGQCNAVSVWSWCMWSGAVWWVWCAVVWCVVVCPPPPPPFSSSEHRPFSGITASCLFSSLHPTHHKSTDLPMSNASRSL